MTDNDPIIVLKYDDGTEVVVSVIEVTLQKNKIPQVVLKGDCIAYKVDIFKIKHSPETITEVPVREENLLGTINAACNKLGM